MKGKKLLLLGLGLGMSAVLASCGGLSEEAANKLIEKAFTMNVVTTSKGTIVTDTIVADLSATSNDSLIVTTKQTVKDGDKKYDVDFEYTWEDSEEAPVVKEYTDIEDDTTHKVVTFNYPYQGKDPIEFTVKGTGKLSGFVVSKDFKIRLNPTTIEFDEIKISDLYKKNSAGNNFAYVDTTTGKIKPNHSNAFYYVTVKGKLTYISPDGNWALMGDGEHSAQLYQIAKSVATWKNLVVGKYYEVDCEVSNGYGNIQLSFISRMDECSGEGIADPVGMGVLPEGINNKDNANFHAFFCGDSNRDAELSNVTLKTYSSSSFKYGARYTFTVTNGSEDIIIAYDYHVAASGNKDQDEVYKAFKTVLDGATVGSTKLDIKGTFRWADADGKNNIGPNGAWQVVPYLASHIAVHA